jgi:hypothetical protein
MKRVPGTGSIRPLLLCGLMICSLPGGRALGQAPSPDAFPKRASGLPPAPPHPSLTLPGIQLFRQLLAAKPDEREPLLAGKNPAQRLVLEKGVREYEALSPEAREWRLRTMELRYQLTALLRDAPSNRLERLKLVPEKDRLPIEDRLKIWDGLSSEEQSILLESERIIRIMSMTGSGTVKGMPLSNQASNQARLIEQQLLRWQSLPPTRREQVQRHFTNLFELTDAEKARERLQPLPLNEAERAVMQATLDQFKKLAPAQRMECVRNFEKFAELSPAERRQFLVNAQEWQRMRPEDREAWRKLVSKVPPLPPLPTPRPPAPPAASRLPRGISTAQKTN